MTEKIYENLYGELRNSIQHYTTEFSLTRGETKKLMWKKFNCLENAFMKLGTTENLIEKITLILKAFEKLQKIC